MPENTREWIDALLAQKERQRSQYRNWKLRPESVKFTTVAGYPAVVALADFAQSPDRPQVERITWIFGPEHHAFFFGAAFPDRLEAYVASVEKFLETVRVR